MLECCIMFIKKINIDLSYLGEEAKTAQEHQLVTLLPDPQYHYKDPVTEYLGPSPPNYKVGP